MAETTNLVIIQMYSLMTLHSAKIPMAMVMVTMPQAIMVMRSNLTRPNGQILTVTVTVIIMEQVQ